MLHHIVGYPQMKGEEGVFVILKLTQQYQFRICHTIPTYLDLVPRIDLLKVPILLMVEAMMMIHVDEYVYSEYAAQEHWIV